MSAEVLWEAAAAMRRDPDERWHAVADLLDDDWLDEYSPPFRNQALTVARAYLGTQP